ncbi:hypothetical protein CAEBREN_30430 [Caenorhabditis brenneri]|uniref:Uncharacterized protein n=1 Tax=Caenorhabditis brenneri TaxID=135651 RepID=G0P1E4_CAEBE|nr:hypothetical protein CAEBREN_30430 [Caenorhabditis brenneri]
MALIAVSNLFFILGGFGTVPMKIRKEGEGWFELENDGYGVQMISARHERGFTTGQLDEHAWQVQNNITAIKRRLKQLIESTPQVVPLDTSSDIRCIEMYEEKQLMATQGMLREDILEEKQRIAKLLWRLEVMGNNEEEKKDPEEAVDEDQEEWAERCKLEEAARSALLEEITRLRSACADLRARLEMESLRRDYDSV